MKAMKQVVAQAPKVGRPLSFDRDVALHQAMLLFWRHGYEATSLSALTAAMGLNPPSLYAAFGDKKRLFLAAVERYVSGPVTSDRLIDEAPTAKDAARGLLLNSAHGFTGSDTPTGCLLATSTLSCSAGAADVQEAVADIRRGVERHLRTKITADIVAGVMSPATDAASLAAMTMAVIQGMSTLARDGAPRKKLTAIAKLALKAWPP